MSPPLARSRLRTSDILRLGVSGLLARRTRVFLSALGIAIGIAAMIAVVGISTSSQAKLAATLDELGTNLLSASHGQDFFGKDAQLPLTARESAANISGVEGAASGALIQKMGVYRNSEIPEGNTNGLGVRAVSPQLLSVLGAELNKGTWFTDGTLNYPVVVLGSDAAKLLGITEPGKHVVISKTEYHVLGILKPVTLAAEIDRSALIGESAAQAAVGERIHPTEIYLRVEEDRIREVSELIAPTIHPQKPAEVKVNRPSDALAAKQAADQAFTGMLVGLGSVALLVGGIGVANTMVISVLERRHEIGLRRALGAERAHIRSQFLAEALFLSLLGGISGVVLGVGVTALFAQINGWPVSIPAQTLAGGLGATLIIGAIAGLYPAIRAARISPTEALQS